MRRKRAVRLALVEHGRGEKIVCAWVVRLVVLEPAEELAAEEGVERVTVVVEEHRVLGLDVGDGVDPALHGARAERQREQRHLRKKGGVAYGKNGV